MWTSFSWKITSVYLPQKYALNPFTDTSIAIAQSPPTTASLVAEFGTVSKTSGLYHFCN